MVDHNNPLDSLENIHMRVDCASTAILAIQEAMALGCSNAASYADGLYAVWDYMRILGMEMHECTAVMREMKKEAVPCSK